jgi:cob(I)alamin adenosyltransferase
MDTNSIHAGDDGNTETLSGKRIPKTDLRIETLGELDEVQSVLGIIRSLSKQNQTRELLFKVQEDLQQIMGEIASDASKLTVTNTIDDDQLNELENSIRVYQERDGLPKGFLIPGIDSASALIDLGRTVVRRVERRVVAAYRAKIIRNQIILRYMNRLSTLLYFMEIHEVNLTKKQRPKKTYSS